MSSKNVTRQQEVGGMIAERLVSIPATAERLGVSPWTVRWWIQRGQITSNKLFGRRMVPESEIQRLIAESRVPARAEAD